MQEGESVVFADSLNQVCLIWTRSCLLDLTASELQAEKRARLDSAGQSQTNQIQSDHLTTPLQNPSKSFSFVALQDLLCQFGDPSTLAFKDHLQAGKVQLVNITRESKVLTS